MKFQGDTAMHLFRRRLVAATVALAAGFTLLAVAGTAKADPPVVDSTTVFKNGGSSQPDTNPCTGSPAIDYNLAGRGTVHLTEFADGTTHVSMSFHTDFVIDTVDPTEVDFSGHETDTFVFEGTNGAATTAVTFTPVLTGTDGTHLVAHEVGHFTVTANGDVKVSFDRFSGFKACP